MLAAARSPDNCPALVLNADHRPLSYFPLSLWSWQDTIKAVFLERVTILAEYDRVVHSPSFEMRLPSVVSLKTYVKPARNPAFTRFNLFLRDRFECQYCGDDDDLTFDHVIPRSRGGRTTWENVVTACAPCNLMKGGKPAAAHQACIRATAPHAHRHRTAQQRPQIPAQLSSRKLGGLSLLGQRAGALSLLLSRNLARTASHFAGLRFNGPLSTSPSRAERLSARCSSASRTLRAHRAACSSGWNFPDKQAHVFHRRA